MQMNPKIPAPPSSEPGRMTFILSAQANLEALVCKMVIPVVSLMQEKSKYQPAIFPCAARSKDVRCHYNSGQSFPEWELIEHGSHLMLWKAPEQANYTCLSLMTEINGQCKPQRVG